MVKLCIASFDIGRRNFAFYVEEIDTQDLDCLKTRYQGIPKNKRYRQDGTCSDELQDILNLIFDSGERVKWKLVDLTRNNTLKGLHPNIFYNMTDILLEHQELWNQCDIILIEEQRTVSTANTRLGQHCLSYFQIMYRDFKPILYYPSNKKTKLLGCPKGKNQGWRKKWAAGRALNIMEQRDDLEGAQYLKSKRKGDDLGDCVIQLQAYKLEMLSQK